MVTQILSAHFITEVYFSTSSLYVGVCRILNAFNEDVCRNLRLINRTLTHGKRVNPRKNVEAKLQLFETMKFHSFSRGYEFCSEWINLIRESLYSCSEMKLFRCGKEGLCLWLGLVQGACELVHFSIGRCSEKKVVHFCVRFKITNEHDQVPTMIRWQNRVRICRHIASFCIKLIDYSVTLILNYFRIAAGFYRKILFINLAGSMVVNSLMLLQITDVRTRTISRNVIQYCFPKLCWNNFSTFF